MHYIGHFLYHQKVPDVPFLTLRPDHVLTHMSSHRGRFWRPFRNCHGIRKRIKSASNALYVRGYRNTPIMSRVYVSRPQGSKVEPSLLILLTIADRESLNHQNLGIKFRLEFFFHIISKIEHFHTERFDNPS